MNLARRAREIGSVVRRFRPLVATVAATSLALALLEGASVTLIVPFLQSFRPGSEPRLRLLIVAIAVLVALRALFAYLNGVLSARLQLRVLLQLREGVAEALYRSRFSDLAGLGAGKLVNLFSVQTERVVEGIHALVALANGALLLAVYGTALVLLSWKMSVAALVLAMGGVGIAVYAGRRIRERSIGMVTAEENASRLALDDVSGLHVIRAHHIGAERLALHRHANERVYRETMGLHRWRSVAKPATDVFYAATLLAALWIALTVAPGWLFGAIPSVLAFLFVLHRLQGQLGAVSGASVALAEQEGAARNVFAFLAETATRDPEGPDEVRWPLDRLSVGGVVFGYRPEPVLRGLDLELRRGEVVAVVGSSGAGKSTLVQLLARLHAARSGRIVLDEVPLDRLARMSLATNLAVVFEDGFVFDESVEWNITLGREFVPEEIRSAARAARLDEVIASLPDGYRSRVGPRGLVLSAGQRQRLALARAIVGRPQVLVLDEATNALDGVAERAILRELRCRRPDGITLIVAHRLSTVMAADRVVLVEHGRVDASGTHEGLMETSEAYRHLVESQLAANQECGTRGAD